MKRFVTYLYECERGNKSKNVGFIRVNVREDTATMEAYLRNLVKGMDKGKLFVLIYKEVLQGFELGELKVTGGQSDARIEVNAKDINGKGVPLADVEGIGIRLDSGIYIASCWKDTYADEIVKGEFIEEKEFLVDSDEKKREEVLVVSQTVSNQDEIVRDGPSSTYEKIDLSQIRDLPSPNWHLVQNSFLVHGFWNYGYLVLKKNVEENQKTLSLGVPGIYEKPEAVMATLFGFPKFEAISKEMVAVENEKNQETEVGTFGCWFVELKL